MNKQLKMPPIHPGGTLQRQFFQPLNLTNQELAQDLHLPLYQLEDLIEGRSSVTAEIAYRLGRYFQIEPEVFLNLQQHYDLELWKDRQEVQVKRQVKPHNQLHSRV